MTSMPCLTDMGRPGSLPILAGMMTLLTASLMASPSALARTDKDCLATWERPKTIIEEVSAKPSLNRKKTAGQIERVAKKSGYIKPKGHGSLLGLTHASFTPSISVGTRSLEVEKGKFCLRLSQVTLTFGIRKTEIYIDRKYRKSTCAYKEILAHEQEHVRINQRVVDEYTPKVSKKLKKYASMVKPFFTRDPDKAMQSIINRLSSDLKPIFKEFGEQREKANDVIDTRASYEATRKRCKDW